jgi:hypothetical protein
LAGARPVLAADRSTVLRVVEQIIASSSFAIDNLGRERTLGRRP